MNQFIHASRSLKLQRVKYNKAYEEKERKIEEQILNSVSILEKEHLTIDDIYKFGQDIDKEYETLHGNVPEMNKSFSFRGDQILRDVKGNFKMANPTKYEYSCNKEDSNKFYDYFTKDAPEVNIKKLYFHIVNTILGYGIQINKIYKDFRYFENHSTCWISDYVFKFKCQKKQLQISYWIYR